MPDHTITNTPLDAGSYDIIRARLDKSRNTLEEKLQLLNASRKEVFGASESELKATIRIHTDNNCIAQDIIAFEDKCLFGFNVHIGLRSVTKVSDVFAVYHYANEEFTQDDFSIINDAEFEQDLENLYKYYRNSEFYRFWSHDAYFYMIFKVSDKEGDYKAFKWMVNGSELSYIDNRSEHEYKVSNQYGFEWKKTSRDDFRNGPHPHVSILERVFVETVGGDLTIKVEDNTDDGKGIYRELVTDKDQQLDDAEISYADLGTLIALRIKPYLEDARYFIYNEKLEEVFKMDAMADSCQLLPDNQGVIASNAYYLQTGLHKKFEADTSKKRYETTISSLNGEDHMYVFYDPKEGRYVLMSYNVISQVIESPSYCNGYGIFADGTLGFFRRDAEPTKYHTIQLWDTPYGKDQQAPGGHEDHLLYKIGNKEIVSFMAECSTLISLIKKENLYTDLYQDIVNLCVNIRDAYYWIKSEEAQELSSDIEAIKISSEVAIGEYQKVVSIRKVTLETTAEVQQKAKKLFKDIDILSLDNITTFVDTLTSLREVRGSLLALKDLRYVDVDTVTALENDAVEKNLQLEKSCVRFLLTKESLEAYKKRIADIEKAIPKIKSSVLSNDQASEAAQIGKDLELLIDIVGSLKIDDPSETTKIIERISSLYSHLNGIKSRIKQKHKEIRIGESQAEFDAQLKLLEQSVISSLEMADTPDACLESLNRLMLILEDIEGKFIDQDSYVSLLHDKREEIHGAFESRRLQLVETLSKRTMTLVQSGQRLISGISKRAHKLDGPASINGFYAADMMTQKVRSIVADLRSLGDSIKADDLLSQLKSSKEEVLRSLRDKEDLHVEGGNILQFGKNKFSINTQALELTILPVDDALNVHLTGTNFFQKIEDSKLQNTADLWDQTYISEDQDLYRGEYLLYEYIQDKGGIDKIDAATLEEGITQFAATRLTEGYGKGIHNADATAIGKEIIKKHNKIGALKYSGDERAWGRFFWEFGLDKEAKSTWLQKIETTKSILKNFANANILRDVSIEMNTLMKKSQYASLFEGVDSLEAAHFIIESLVTDGVPVVSGQADTLATSFGSHLKMIKAIVSYEESKINPQKHPEQALECVSDWLSAYITQARQEVEKSVFLETAVHLLTQSENKVLEGSSLIEVQDLIGEHPLIDSGNYNIKYNQFFRKLRTYKAVKVPRITAFKALKNQYLEEWKQRLRLEEFRPKVLSSFVRNQLIDKVYLPIIGDNLAKQIGTVGDNSRTDRMGLLLLVSPPGYGKTTLMEYVADRLGLTFVKVNGPSIGHDITSLDPDNAQSSGARQELEKLNLSFEIGDNIMIYLDDIQHCSSEFLQKFISLTDGQRKIEGSYNGKSKTYDFRGKKVAVVMAGNPYTETGEKFHVPDMLANRADVYNLGDMLAGTETYFNNSYVENALSSNTYLQRLASKSLQDVYTILDHMKSGDLTGMELESNHTPEELDEYMNVLGKLLRVRDVVLLVNQSYIKSAATNDNYRVEPPFKLQGSYRNMNKMAEKIVPLMNDAEVETLIIDHYKSEVQTLTSNSEANFLLFKRLINKLTTEEEGRLSYIIKTYQEEKAERSGDFIQPVIKEIKDFNEILRTIRDQMGKG